jgi:AraC family transcriptional regulator
MRDHRLTPHPRCNYHGKTFLSREVGGFTVREMTHPPGLRVPKHAHERAHLAFVLRGEFTERCEGKTLECRPLSVSFLPPGLSHADDFSGGAHSLLVDIASSRFERLRSVVSLREPVFSRGGDAAWLMMRLYREAGATDEASALAVEGLALEILALLSRGRTDPTGSRPPRWLTEAQELIHARFRTTTTHEELANAVGVHPVYLAGEFRKHFGSTIGTYIRRLRVEHASRELVTSDRALVEIALAAGFADQSHFSKVFKRLACMTPSQFRACARGTRGAPNCRGGFSES